MVWLNRDHVYLYRFTFFLRLALASFFWGGITPFVPLAWNAISLRSNSIGYSGNILRVAFGVIVPTFPAVARVSCLLLYSKRQEDTGGAVVVEESYWMMGKLLLDDLQRGFMSKTGVCLLGRCFVVRGGVALEGSEPSEGVPQSHG